MYRVSADEFTELFEDYVFEGENDGADHDDVVEHLKSEYNYMDVRCDFIDWYITIWGIRERVADLVGENSTGFGAREIVLAEMKKLEKIALENESEFAE